MEHQAWFNSSSKMARWQCRPVFWKSLPKWQSSNFLLITYIEWTANGVKTFIFELIECQENVTRKLTLWLIWKSGVYCVSHNLDDTQDIPCCTLKHDDNLNTFEYHATPINLPLFALYAFAWILWSVVMTRQSSALRENDLEALYNCTMCFIKKGLGFSLTPFQDYS